MSTISVCLSFDFDAMSSWIYAYRTKSPNALSRGEFGAVGARRLLTLLGERQLASTWFVPGHSAEAFPDVVELLVEGGHEIGHHGYCHEDPSRMERDEEIVAIDRGIEVLRASDRLLAGRLSLSVRQLQRQYPGALARAWVPLRQQHACRRLYPLLLPARRPG